MAKYSFTDEDMAIFRKTAETESCIKNYPGIKAVNITLPSKRKSLRLSLIADRSKVDFDYEDILFSGRNLADGSQMDEAIRSISPAQIKARLNPDKDKLMDACRKAVLEQAEKCSVPDLIASIGKPRALSHAAGYAGIDGADVGKIIGCLALLHSDNAAIQAVKPVTVPVQPDVFTKCDLVDSITVILSVKYGHASFHYDWKAGTAVPDQLPDMDMAHVLDKACHNLDKLDLIKDRIKAYGFGKNDASKIHYNGDNTASLTLIQKHTESTSVIPLDGDICGVVDKACAESEEAEKKAEAEFFENIKKRPYFGSYAAEAIAYTVLTNSRYITINTLPKLLRGLSNNVEILVVKNKYFGTLSPISSADVSDLIDKMASDDVITLREGHTYGSMDRSLDYTAVEPTNFTEKFYELSAGDPNSDVALAERLKDGRVEDIYGMVDKLMSRPGIYCADADACAEFLHKAEADDPTVIEYIKLAHSLEDDSAKKKHIKRLMAL